MIKPSMTRRSALKALGAGAGAAALLPWLSEEAAAAFAHIQGTSAAPKLLVFSPPQYAIVETLVEAIIPADERSPGAKEARVADYIDLLLSELEDGPRQQWLEGLAALEAEASDRFGLALGELNASQIEALLNMVSANERPPEGVEQTPAERFFVELKQATLAGYYTSEIGIHQELHYKGNQFLAEYVGCETENGKDCPHCGQKAEV